jgi:hypothetical protein
MADRRSSMVMAGRELSGRRGDRRQ